MEHIEMARNAMLEYAQEQQYAEDIFRLESGKYAIVGKSEDETDTDRTKKYQEAVDFFEEQEQRGFLPEDFSAKYEYYNGKCAKVQNVHTGESTRIFFDLDTPALTRDDVEKIEEIREGYRQEKRKKEEQEHKKLIEYLQDVLENRIEKDFLFQHGTDVHHDFTHSSFEDLKKIEYDLEEQIREKREKYLEEQRKIEEKKQAEYEREREKWIREYGSDRLQTVLAEGYAENSDRVYREERLRHECPNWKFSDLEYEEILNPTQEELGALIEEKERPVKNQELVFVEYENDVCEEVREVYIVGSYMGDEVSIFVNER